MISRTIGALGILLVLTCGCSMKTLVVASFESTLEDIRVAFYEEKSPRQAEMAAPALLKILDSLVIAAPENENILFEGTQMYGSYGLSFAEEDLEWAAALHERGFRYGVRLLDLSSGGWTEAFDRGLPAIEARLERAEKSDLPALFWTAANWASLINATKRDVSAIADLPQPTAILQWVYDQDPTYFHGGPALFLARYHSSRPAHLGGQPELARTYFEKSIRISDDRFLLAKVYYARDYARSTQNLELYERLLREVLDAPDDILPEFMLGTAVAKKKARQLLAEKRLHFNLPEPDPDSDDDLPGLEGSDLPTFDED